MSGTVRWGVLSTADIAVRKVIPGIRKAARCEVVAIASRDATVARSVADRLGIPTAARDTLLKLGVSTVGQFLDLPLDGVGVRFGPEVRRLHRLASGTLREPLKPAHPDLPAMRRVILDHPEFDASRIVALASEALGPILDEIGAKGRALVYRPKLAFELSCRKGVGSRGWYVDMVGRRVPRASVLDQIVE